MLLRRFRRRRRRLAAPATLRPDRAALLRELEVAVPAPERIVRWETAAGRPQRLSST
jgi:hypothetical protein